MKFFERNPLRLTNRSPANTSAAHCTGHCKAQCTAPFNRVFEVKIVRLNFLDQKIGQSSFVCILRVLWLSVFLTHYHRQYARWKFSKHNRPSLKEFQRVGQHNMRVIIRDTNVQHTMHLDASSGEDGAQRIVITRRSPSCRSTSPQCGPTTCFHVSIWYQIPNFRMSFVNEVWLIKLQFKPTRRENSTPVYSRLFLVFVYIWTVSRLKFTLKLLAGLVCTSRLSRYLIDWPCNLTRITSIRTETSTI